MKKIYFLVTGFVYLLFIIISVNAQEHSKAEELKIVESLKARFNLFHSFQKEKKYEKLYEMLAQEQRKATTKEFFVKTYRNSEKSDDTWLTAFAIKRTGLLQLSNSGIVEGCGEYTNNKKKAYYYSKVEAVYENDDWYFHTLIGPSVGFGAELKKCKMPKVKKVN